MEAEFSIQRAKEFFCSGLNDALDSAAVLEASVSGNQQCSPTNIIACNSFVEYKGFVF